MSNEAADHFKECLKEVLKESLAIDINRANGWVEVEISFDGEVIDSDSLMIH